MGYAGVPVTPVQESSRSEQKLNLFYMQLFSNVFYVAIGFLLSEVAVLAEKRRKDRRAAESN